MRTLLGFLLLATLCQAEQSCPWLNASTAAGVLGGPVQATYSPNECRFVGPQGELEITVPQTKSPLAGCESQPAPLKGIGNESVVCTANGSEQVAGRVRDSSFVIRLRSTEKDRAKLINVAEQVAGSLF